jgi:hypothetical protein
MDKLGYIPGDLVYIHGSLRIISNCDGYYATYYDENESLQEVNVNVIEGIPFTLDIIIKNGWMENRYTDMFYKAIGEGRYVNLRVEGQTWIVGLAHQDLLKNIKYVHELQHLLYGLKLNSEMEV